MEKPRRERATSIGGRIKRFRLAVGMTQTQLALALGITYQSIQRYEQGKVTIASDRLLSLAEVLKVPVQDILLPVHGRQVQGVYLEPVTPLSEEETDLIRAFRSIPDRDTRKAIQVLARRLMQRA